MSIAATGDKAYLIDQIGGMQVIRPQEGRYLLNLTGAVCDDRDGCAIGGRPLLLVQTQATDTILEITAAGAIPLAIGAVYEYPEY